MLFQGIKQQRAVSETLHKTVKYIHFDIFQSGKTPLPVSYFASYLQNARFIFQIYQIRGTYNKKQERIGVLFEIKISPDHVFY